MEKLFFYEQRLLDMQSRYEKCTDPKIIEITYKAMKRIETKMTSLMKRLQARLPSNQRVDVDGSRFKYLEECIGTDAAKTFENETGGQKERKSAGSILKNPSSLLAAIKEAKRQMVKRSPEQQAAMETELLAGEQPQEAPVIKKKRSKKKGKKQSKRTKASKQSNPLEKGFISGCSAEAKPQVTELQKLQKVVSEALSNQVPKEDSHYLHSRVRRWDSHNLTGKKIATWQGYERLTRQARMRKIVNHMGAGLHKFLDSPRLHNDYVFESSRGPMMWCTILLQDKTSITGKIHFGVTRLPNGKNLVYHRGFTEATPSEFNSFIDSNAPEAFDQEVSLPDEVQVGNVQGTVNEDRSITCKPKAHAYVKILLSIVYYK